MLFCSATENSAQVISNHLSGFTTAPLKYCPYYPVQPETGFKSLNSTVKAFHGREALPTAAPSTDFFYYPALPWS